MLNINLNPSKKTVFQQAFFTLRKECKNHYKS